MSGPLPSPIVPSKEGDAIQTKTENPADWTARARSTDAALLYLSHARDYLREAGATKALEAVRKAISSAEGARRHARGRAASAAVNT